MKKILVFILAFVYLGTSIGATIHIHYCMGKLVEWRFGSDKAEICSNCGMNNIQKDKNKDCCKDEHKLIKLDKDQRTVENSIQLTQFSEIPSISSLINYQEVIIPSLSKDYPTNNSPPRNQDQSLYLLNSTFLI